MNKTSKVLAFDFGASSGRALLFTFDGEKLSMEEMHRFSNDPVMVSGTYRWDVMRLFFEIKQGILNTINNGHKDFEAIGIDTWGVDFGLLDKNGQLIANPYHYRDTRTNGMIEEADKMVGKKYIFDRTGIQFNFFNTIFQLLAMVKNDDPALKIADKLLFTPDLFNYFLTGEKKNEYTISSTSQLINPYTKSWDDELLEKMGIDKNLFCDIVKPGEIIGTLSDDICEELGCPKVPVIAVGSHDTASAVASVPATGGYDYAYISTGTWALLGVEADEPIITDKSFEYDFTNEGGVEDKIRFLKNIMGLWIIQESRRQWKREGKDFSFDALEKAAWDAAPFESFIDPDYETFATPGNMPEKIREYCRKTGQKVPETEGEVIRCAAQSLAMKCAYAIKGMEDTLGKKLDVIHMVGGGIKDTMVCTLISCASGKKVVAGPVEATGTGNALMQLTALGKVKSLTDARKVVINSFDTKEYLPQDQDAWAKAYDKFKAVTGLK